MCVELCQSAEIMGQLQYVDMYIRVAGVGRGSRGVILTP